MIKTFCKSLVSHFIGCRKAVAVILVALTVTLSFPVQFVRSVSIIDGEDSYKVYTFQNDADDILSSNSIEVGERDDVEVLNNSGNSNESITIKINRAFPITLKIGNEQKTLEVTDGTVEDVLKTAGFELDKDDKVNHDLKTNVYEGMEISVTDIEYETVTKTKVLKYKTIKTKTSKLKVGEKKVVTEGKNGSEAVTKLVKRKNGKIVSSKTVDKTTVKPTNREILVGAKIKKANKSKWMSDLEPKKEILLDENGVPTEYKKVIKGTASAYCTGTTCSTGVKVKQGYIAVDPNIIPYGTKMYIRSSDGNWLYGYAIAADTGGFTSWGNTIADLYMYSYSDCVSFGRRGIEIYIL